MSKPSFRPGTRAQIVLVKLAVLFVSMLFLSAGIVLLLKCGLGADPLTLLYDGLSASLGVSYAAASAIYNVSVFFLALVLARKYFGLGTVVVSFTLSFFIGFYDRLFGGIDFASLPYPALFLLMLLGQASMCFGMALSVWADFGQNCSLAVLYRLSDLTGARFKVLKTWNDILFAGAGFLLGGVLGVGTVFSAITTGAAISFFLGRLERRFFKMPQLPEGGAPIQTERLSA